MLSQLQLPHFFPFSLFDSCRMHCTKRITVLLIGGFLAGISPTFIHAQAHTSTASRAADLQVGGYFGFSQTNEFSADKYTGAGGYITLDFKHNLGVEGNFRQVNGADHTYERTYEVGARYVRHYGIFNPYVRLSVGRGVFNFPNDGANIAYNMGALGGGVDVRVMSHINVRGDYDFQAWKSFQGQYLKPQVVSVGAAYHF